MVESPQPLPSGEPPVIRFKDLSLGLRLTLCTMVLLPIIFVLFLLIIIWISIIEDAPTRYILPFPGIIMICLLFTIIILGWIMLARQRAPIHPVTLKDLSPGLILPFVVPLTALIILILSAWWGSG